MKVSAVLISDALHFDFPFQGKENKTPKDENNERKGPMINGVRREVKSPYKQSSSVEEQDVKPAEHENFAAKSTKIKTGLFV